MARAQSTHSRFSTLFMLARMLLEEGTFIGFIMGITYCFFFAVLGPRCNLLIVPRRGGRVNRPSVICCVISELPGKPCRELVEEGHSACVIRKPFLLSPEGWRVGFAAATGEVHGVLLVEHLVVKDIFDHVFGHTRVVKLAVDDDLVE